MSKAANAVLSVIKEEVQEQEKAVGIDMSASMERACREELLVADIVYENFYIDKHISDASGKVVTREHKKLIAEGVQISKRSRYLFLRHVGRLSVKQWA